ncbi:MAG: NAD(P)-dependent oxidoreductase [Muribaculaceae bacterium]|nr:NAD(P)-dependent oxidoreductase [Muribaculaceae bacterium]
MKHAKKTVFLTGATGTMGKEGVKALLNHPEELEVRVLARPSKKNKKMLEPYVKRGELEVVWGDLTDYNDVKRGVEGADYVLHVGGMVSPAADYFPEKTLKVNTTACHHIVKAVKESSKRDSVKVVYIGSISQYGPRVEPHHWGRTGDPLWHAVGDMYAYSKIQGERIIAEAGLPYWVSLRQTGILSPLLVKKGSDPITFHVPLRGALEWATDIDSGRLLANICLADLPEKFWNRFYNLGNGEHFRLGNYEFEQMILKAMSCPPVEKVFKPEWFALDNFHGIWYEDSDVLDEYLHFRSPMTAGEYFEEFAKGLPWFFKLTKIVPSGVIRTAMGLIAGKGPTGPMYWLKQGEDKMIKAAFGSREKWESIPGWSGWKLGKPSAERIRFSHGYDETKEEGELDIEDMRNAARFRGGKCLSEKMEKGDMITPLEWECSEGHRFKASPMLVLKGGHWCDECFGKEPDYAGIAEKNPFFAQVYYCGDVRGKVKK